MRTIHKFPFQVANDLWISLPKGAIVRLVECQGDLQCMWAEVETGAVNEQRHFVITGTGHPIPEGAEFVASFQRFPFAWHVWEMRGDK